MRNMLVVGPEGAYLDAVPSRYSKLVFQSKDDSES